MSELLKKKANLFLHRPNEADFSRTSSEIVKTNEPGPTSYKVVEALNKSAKMRASNDGSIPRAKIINFLSKCILSLIHSVK